MWGVCSFLWDTVNHPALLKLNPIYSQKALFCCTFLWECLFIITNSRTFNIKQKIMIKLCVCVCVCVCGPIIPEGLRQSDQPSAEPPRPDRKEGVYGGSMVGEGCPRRESGTYSLPHYHTIGLGHPCHHSTTLIQRGFVLVVSACDKITYMQCVHTGLSLTN